MADPNHIRILEQGTGTWNKWREENPEVVPDLSNADLKSASIYSFNLESAQLSGADLRGASLGFSNLQNATLLRANLQGASLFSTNFKGAWLSYSNLSGSDLRESNLEEAELEKADLQGANLTEANLQGTQLLDANLQEAQFERANLRGSVLRGANLKKANLRYVNLEEANVARVIYDRRTRFRGIRVATSFGSQRFRRFALDQDYVEELRGNARTWRFWFIYLPWLILADCGRSILLWASWAALFALGFGVKFWTLGRDSFEINNLDFSLPSTIYYSIVTFTTLGFGDITPSTHAAAFWVAAEVVIGYVMLGGLISIFANKFARRSD